MFWLISTMDKFLHSVSDTRLEVYIAAIQLWISNYSFLFFSLKIEGILDI